jgi:hypothetical protein
VVHSRLPQDIEVRGEDNGFQEAGRANLSQPSSSWIESECDDDGCGDDNCNPVLAKLKTHEARVKRAMIVPDSQDAVGCY